MVKLGQLYIQDGFSGNEQILSSEWIERATSPQVETNWGNNGYGQTSVPSLVNPTWVSAGNRHTCAIDDNGSKCWGSNDYGQGALTANASSNPTQVTAGYYHTCIFLQR